MSTNLHIDYIGNLILRDGKLGLSVSSQYVTPPHYGGGRVGALCPYAYCADNPVNCVDPDGRDMCPLLEPQGAGGMGHMAMLIQKTDQKWYLYSKNGTTSCKGFSGPNSTDKGDNIGTGKIVTDPDTGEKYEVGYDDPQDFINSDDNKDSEGNILYSEGFVIESSKSEDDAARNAMIEELNKGYYLLGSNCAYTVQKGLEAAGRSSGHFDLGTDNGIQSLLIPNDRFRMIVRENEGKIIRPINQKMPKK